MTSILAILSGTGDLLSGGTPAGGGGTISIIVDRTMLQVAPDSVRFWVDVDSSSFDTAGPTGGEFYDARMHDLIYLWGFDDAASGNWTAPQNVLTAWKDRNTAKGPFVAHMYTQPGTFTASVLVVEPSSGKTATATVEIVVADPDDVYDGSASGKTVFYNEYGDNDWTWVDANYPGATKQNVASDNRLINNTGISDGLTDGRYDTEWTDHQDTKSTRALFKAGADIDLSILLGGSEVAGLYIGTYGLNDISSAKAILRNPGWASSTSNSAESAIFLQKGAEYAGGLGDTPAPDFRVSDVVMKHDYDSAGDLLQNMEAKDIPLGFRSTFRVDAIFSRVDFEGLGSGSVSTTSPIDMGTGDWNHARPTHIHMDDCTNTDFSNYSIYPGGWNTHVKSSVSLTGCRLNQNPLALDDTTSTRSPFRDGSYRNVHMRGNDVFQVVSYAGLKLANTPREHGLIVNAHSNTFEGGFEAIVIAGNVEGNYKGSDDPSYPTTAGCSPVLNVIIDGNMHYADHTTQKSYYSQATGVTIRNNLTIVAGLGNSGSSYLCFAWIRGRDQLEHKGSATYDRTIVGAAPVRIYNNTIHVLRTTAQNTSSSLSPKIPYILEEDAVESAPLFTNVTENNNLLHMPNLNSPVTTYGPLTTAVLFTPRAVGRREAYSDVEGTMGSNIADDADLFIPYWTLSDGTTDIARSNIREGDTTHTFGVDGEFSEQDASGGYFDIAFGDTGVTITNRSGATWTSGTGYDLTVTCLDLAATQTAFAPPSNTWVDSKPDTGSAALNGATVDERGWLDITGSARLTGSGEGTIDVGAWQVS